MMSVKSKQKNNSKQFHMEKKRNLWAIPTDKPSRLFRSFGKLNIGDYITERENTHIQNQNIYITSDEEIKEGDWVFDLDIKRIVKADNLKVATYKKSQCWYYKKIILTTDQDLINDGVQAIDDEFLEWFVKNPSCEVVEIEDWYNKFLSCCKSKKECHCNKKRIIIPKEEAKQETLEEAAERFIKKQNFNSLEIDDKIFEAILFGAKWQQEQIGKSDFLQKLRGTLSDAEARRLIFEQFKKK